MEAIALTIAEKKELLQKLNRTPTPRARVTTITHNFLFLKKSDDLKINMRTSRQKLDNWSRIFKIRYLFKDPK